MTLSPASGEGWTAEPASAGENYAARRRVRRVIGHKPSGLGMVYGIGFTRFTTKKKTVNETSSHSVL